MAKETFWCDRRRHRYQYEACRLSAVYFISFWKVGNGVRRRVHHALLGSFKINTLTQIIIMFPLNIHIKANSDTSILRCNVI
ncbi:hypothetical protein ACF0H5_009448 [Mactra antiquata]